MKKKLIMKKSPLYAIVILAISSAILMGCQRNQVVTQQQQILGKWNFNMGTSSFVFVPPHGTNSKLSVSDIDKAIAAAGGTHDSFSNLFTLENCELQNTITTHHQNIEALDQLAENRKDVKYFYYKGTKYNRNDVAITRSTIASGANSACSGVVGSGRS